MLNLLKGNTKAGDFYRREQQDEQGGWGAFGPFILRQTARPWRKTAYRATTDFCTI